MHHSEIVLAGTSTGSSLRCAHQVIHLVKSKPTICLGTALKQNDITKKSFNKQTAKHKKTAKLTYLRERLTKAKACKQQRLVTLQREEVRVGDRTFNNSDRDYGDIEYNVR